MFGSHFYHERIRKAVATFGSLFNNLWVVRKDASGKTLNQQKVPLSYAPSDKYLQRIRENASLVDDMKVAIKLPRMSFEMISLAYDPSRMLPKTGNITVSGTDNTKRKKVYNTVPYNVSFQLNIYARSQDDCLQVVEQILPYFSPQYTVTIKPLDDHPTITEDIPVVLNGVSFVDEYEGALEERRTIIYTLDFEMKLNFHSDITDGSIIRKSISNIYRQTATEDLATSRVTVVPDPSDVSADSDFGFSQIVTRYENLFAQTYQLTLASAPAEATASISAAFGVSAISLTDSGAGFSSTPEIIIDSPPEEITATAHAVLDSDSRTLSSIVVDSAGTNYLTTPIVAISSPTAAVRATATATLVGDQVGSISISTAGTNYDNAGSNPNVTIAAPTTAGAVQAITRTDRGSGYPEDTADSAATTGGTGTGLRIAFTTTGDQITTVAIADSGSGYVIGDEVTLVGGNNNAQVSVDLVAGARRATATSTRADTGYISTITITDSGDGYLETPAVTIDSPPAAVTAQATAVLTNQTVTAIAVTNGGTNYTTVPTVTVAAPPGATQATATATTNVTGQITSITVTDPGSNYRTAPTVFITNPVSIESEQFTDSEQVNIAITNDITVRGFVRSWNDSDNILTIDTVSSSNNQPQTIAVGQTVTGVTSNASLVIASIVEGEKGF